MFERIIKENRNRFSNGVVHSFNGSKEELKRLIDLDLYIGINGCGLLTKENLEVVKLIPLDKLLIETDCPFNELDRGHAGYKYVNTKFSYTASDKLHQDKLVKDRNEPCKIV